MTGDTENLMPVIDAESGIMDQSFFIFGGIKINRYENSVFLRVFQELFKGYGRLYQRKEKLMDTSIQQTGFKDRRY